jgi:hydrogenase large subunit
VAKRITVDPITRIEGHLRIDVEVDNGHVTKAWSSGQMWRGIEKILVGRDPREAWSYTQRFCGVCTTVHAITSVRAVENALQLEIPVNAQLIRNIIQTAHAIQTILFTSTICRRWIGWTLPQHSRPIRSPQQNLPSPCLTGR